MMATPKKVQAKYGLYREHNSEMVKNRRAIRDDTLTAFLTICSILFFLLFIASQQFEEFFVEDDLVSVVEDALPVLVTKV